MAIPPILHALAETGVVTVALDGFWSDLASSSLYVKWRTQNPGELGRLKLYAAGGPRPSMSTAFGRALVRVIDLQRATGAPQPTIP